VQNNDVEDLWYIGLGLQQQLKIHESQVILYGRVDNLMDTKPPLDFPTANAGGNYDRIGRYFKVGVRLKM
jgi:hypothetical protein